MAKRVWLEHPDGRRAQVYIGFSWSSLCLGPFPAIARRDWTPATLLVTTLGAAALFVEEAALALIWLAWAGAYNRWHARRLIRSGYRVAFSEGLPMDEARALLGQPSSMPSRTATERRAPALPPDSIQAAHH